MLPFTFDRIFNAYFGSDSFEDHIYVNGQIVRIDRSADQCDELLASYAIEGIPLWCGESSAYKELYSNPTISYYQKATAPFNILKKDGSPKDWYGTKIDTITGEKWYKVEDENYNGAFDSCSVTYATDGTIVAYDYYSYMSVEEMKAFCLENNLSFPVPTSLEDSVWIWGISYGMHNSPQLVKGYVAHG